MSGRVGSITTDIIADGLIFNMDAANRASTIPSTSTTTTFNTLNTSLTTLIVLLAIFTFGGESIRGFMFALIVGVLVGTYSSVFIATPIMFDTQSKKPKTNS